jgi:hypothetical protein
MLVRSLAVTCLLLAGVGAAPAAAQVVDAPHWLAAVIGAQSCDRQADRSVRDAGC